VGIFIPAASAACNIEAPSGTPILMPLIMTLVSDISFTFLFLG
jgi:hypothetical protein